MSRPQSSSLRDFKPNAESSAFNVEPNNLLLVTLSTIVMMAKNKKLSKEYYHCSKFYLESIRDQNLNHSLPNVAIFLDLIDKQLKENTPTDN